MQMEAEFSDLCMSSLELMVRDLGTMAATMSNNLIVLGGTVKNYFKKLIPVYI